MPNSNCAVFYAKNMQELFYQIKSVAGLKIVGGCTALTALPEKSLSILNIPELTHIDKHERYINFGAAVTLTEIIDVGSNRIPEIFREAIKTVANSSIRNIATLGGNICMADNDQKLTLYAPLLALDANIEIRSPTETTLVPLINFKGITEGHVATHIRVPINEWDVSIFRRIGPSHKINNMSASFAFLASSEKNIITNIRIALAGNITFRARDLENRLIGTHLPLSEKDVEQAIVGARKTFDTYTKGNAYESPLREQYLNLIEYAIEQLT